MAGSRQGVFTPVAAERSLEQAVRCALRAQVMQEAFGRVGRWAHPRLDDVRDRACASGRDEVVRR